MFRIKEFFHKTHLAFSRGMQMDFSVLNWSSFEWKTKTCMPVFFFNSKCVC